MLDDREYRPDASYTLALTPPNRPAAATEISIRVDDGADIVIDVSSQTNGKINAYLTVDEAEDLYAALTEILRFPSDLSGAIDLTSPVRAGNSGPKR